MVEKYLYGKVYIQHLSNCLSVSGKEYIRVCLTPTPLRAPSFCFLTSPRRPHVEMTQALAEPGVSAVLPGDEPAESSSEGPVEEQ